MSWSEIYLRDQCRHLAEPLRERELEHRRMLAEACAVNRQERDVQGMDSFLGRVGGRLLQAAAALVKPSTGQFDAPAEG